MQHEPRTPLSLRGRTALTLILALPAALAACSSSDNGGGTTTRKDAGSDADGGSTGDGGTPSGFDTASLSTTLAAAQCAFYTRCVPAVFQATDITAANCTQKVAESVKAQYDAFAPLVVAGRLTYHADQVSACTAELAQLDCDLGQLDDSPCGAILSGTQATGQACELSAECGSGLWCQRMNGFGSCGTCQAVAARGASCAAAPCAANTRCIDVAQQGQPANPLCIPIDSAEGQPCFTVANGLCRGSLQCVGTMSFTCQRAPAQGGTCDAMNGTAPDCDLGRNLACSGGTCQSVTWGTVGSMCGDLARCGGESYCPTGASTCAALPGAGQSCADTGACSTDLYCNDQSTCAAVKASGTPCTSGTECAGDLSCIGASGAATCGDFAWMKCN